MGPKKQEKISVIVPVYNVEPYLQKCLHSILDGSYQNLEVICVNDGSTDNCLRILVEAAAEDSRLIVINQNQRGVSAARNRGLARATGRYIAFIDADDYVHPHYFRTMMRCMEAKHADIVICGVRRFKEGDMIKDVVARRIHYYRHSPASLYNSRYARKMIWARIYRKESLGDNLFCVDEHYSEDTLFNLSVIRDIRDPVIYETKVPLYYYLMRENSLVRTRKTEKMLDMAKWYLANRGNRRKEPNGWEWILLSNIIKQVVSYRYLVMYQPGYKERRQEIDDMLKELLKEIDHSRNVSRREKLLLHVMCRVPHAYRLFRIATDFTLLDWEKTEKAYWQNLVQNGELN